MVQEIRALFATTKSIRVDNESYFGSRLRLLYRFIISLLLLYSNKIFLILVSLLFQEYSKIIIYNKFTVKLVVNFMLERNIGVFYFIKRIEEFLIEIINSTNS